MAIESRRKSCIHSSSPCTTVAKKFDPSFRPLLLIQSCYPDPRRSMTGRRPPRSSRRDISPPFRASSSRLDSPATASSSRAGSTQPHRRLHRKKQPVLAHGLPFEDHRLLSDWPIEGRSHAVALDKAKGQTPLAEAIARVATSILARRQNERRAMQPEQGSTDIQDQQRSGISEQDDVEPSLNATAADVARSETNGSPSPAPSSRSASSIEFHTDDEQSSRPAQRRQDSLGSASPSRLSDASSSTTWDEDLLDRSNDHAPDSEELVPPSLLQPLISVVQTKLNRVLFDLSEKRETLINPRRARTRKLDWKDVLSCLGVQRTLPVGDGSTPPPNPVLAKVRRRLEATMSLSSAADEQEREEAEAGPSRLEAEGSSSHAAAASSPVRRFPQGRSELDAFLLYDRYPNEVQESKKRKRVRTKDKQQGSPSNAKSVAAASVSGRSDAEVEQLFEEDEHQAQSSSSPTLAQSRNRAEDVDEDNLEGEVANRPPAKKRRVRNPPPRPVRDSRSGLLLTPAPSRSSTNRRKKR